MCIHKSFLKHLIEQENLKVTKHAIEQDNIKVILSKLEIIIVNTITATSTANTTTVCTSIMKIRMINISNISSTFSSLDHGKVKTLNTMFKQTYQLCLVFLLFVCFYQSVKGDSYDKQSKNHKRKGRLSL